MKKNKHTFVVLAYKESSFLETCIQSVLNQKCKSNVVIATSTPCDYIDTLGKKYDIEVIQNPNAGKGIGADFDFAWNCTESELITIAHQDDVYDYEYSYDVLKKYNMYSDAQIIFSDCYEIHADRKVMKNLNMNIKRTLLFPLKINYLAKCIWVKRLILRFGNSICCPAVTFVQGNIKSGKLFECDMKCNVDWFAWEKLSREKGRFVFIDKKIMGHRVHDESTTTEIIRDNIRTKEDLIMFKKFWPQFIARALVCFYKKSEKNNDN